MGIFSNVLLCSDYDNTLTGIVDPAGLDENGDVRLLIPDDNLREIEKFKAEGGLFTVSSGRARSYYKDVISKSVTPNAPLILGNGADIYDAAADEDVLIRAMDDSALAMAKDMIARFPQITVEAHRTDTICVIYCAPWDEFHCKNFSLPPDEFKTPWTKIVFVGPKDEISKAVEYLWANYPEFSAVHSSDTVCETQAPGVTKGTAARYLADKLGRSVLVCVGDSPNDIEMLQEADYAFVAADGKESVRALGFRSAAPCTQGTVADAIRQLRAILEAK